MLLREAKELLKKNGYRVIKENGDSIEQMKQKILSVLEEKNLSIDRIDSDLTYDLYGDGFGEYCEEEWYTGAFSELSDEEQWECYMEDKSNEDILNDMIAQGYPLDGLYNKVMAL